MACRICSHPEIREIERELAEGMRYHQIAKRFFCDPHSVRYHALNCMAEKLQVQRFNVQKERLQKQLVRLGKKLERQQQSNIERLKRAVAEDLIDAFDCENRTLRTPKNVAGRHEAK